jgi:RNA polymerase sigma-70 factor, ECF subfamily
VIDIVLKPIPEVEESLVMQARAGDRNAYGELVGRCYEDVIRVVYRLCGDTQLAQDAAQEAFMRAWVRLPGYQSRAPFSHWIMRIAVNTALDSLRKKPQENIETVAETALMAEAAPGPEAAYLEKEQRDFVQGAVNALPEAARTVLVLREYGGLSYEEIATALEIPVGTVMSRLNYARNRLREMLREDHLETEREYA